MLTLRQTVFIHLFKVNFNLKIKQKHKKKLNKQKFTFIIKKRNSWN